MFKSEVSPKKNYPQYRDKRFKSSNPNNNNTNSDKMEIEIGTSVKSTPTQKQSVDHITRSEKDLIKKHLNIKQQKYSAHRKGHSHYS
jgi:hypothetical protein